MIGMISNPTKKITLDMEIEEVKKIMGKLEYFIDDVVKMTSKDDIIAEYEYDFSRSMIGNVISISLNGVDGNKTEVNIESKRKVGSYNSGSEVTTANIDIKSTLKGISKLVENPELEPTKEDIQKQRNTQESDSTITIIGVVLLVIAMLFFMLSCANVEPNSNMSKNGGKQVKHIKW